MLVNIFWFLMGMIVMYLLRYLMSFGHSVNVIKQTQHSCALLFTESEQGLHEVLELKYIAMREAERSDQNIIAQKYIDQLNISTIQKSIMRNYVGTFPSSYRHVMEYSSWEELEDYVNKFVQDQKGAK